VNPTRTTMLGISDSVSTDLVMRTRGALSVGSCVDLRPQVATVPLGTFVLEDTVTVLAGWKE
jgi:hypothetical protein